MTWSVGPEQLDEWRRVQGEQLSEENEYLFNFGHSKFEMPIRHHGGNIKYIADHQSGVYQLSINCLSAPSLPFITHSVIMESNPLNNFALPSA